MLKKINKVLSLVILIGTIIYIFPPYFSSTFATTSFEVDIEEILSVSVSTPTEWASGYAEDFLLNTINVSVTSNNGQGFTAGMTTNSDDTSLKHIILNNESIPTLENNEICLGDNCNNFPSNHWGYSLDGITYKPLLNSSAAPITILSSVDNGSESSDILFGARTDYSQPSGTYYGTIVINVVTGTGGVDLPAPSPDDPTPVTPPSWPYSPEYNQESDSTTYTYITDDGNTTTTLISEGDDEDLYDSYTPPQGVKQSSKSNINSGSLITIIFTITASVAATSGVLFFILAKRKKDEDSDNDQ